MKVCFYTTSILENYGGLEKWMVETSVGLKYRYPELEITIITMDDNFSNFLRKILNFILRRKTLKSSIYKEHIKNIENELQGIKYLKFSNFKDLRVKLKIFDVIYSKNELLEGLLFKFFIGYKGLPRIIYGCHTSLNYNNSSIFRNFLYSSFIYNFLTSEVSIFHVLNTSDEKILRKLGRKTTLIFNPLNREKFEKGKKNIPIENNNFIIHWYGRITKQKGIDFLEDIIIYLSDNYSDIVTLKIAGNGGMKYKIDELQKKYKFIKYYGYIQNKEIVNFLQNGNLGIITSQGESYGLTVIESNLVNIPVLCFDIPGPGDLVMNGKNGIKVKNKIEYLKTLDLFITNKIVINKSKKFITEKLNDERIYKQLYNLIINKD